MPYLEDVRVQPEAKCRVAPAFHPLSCVESTSVGDGTKIWAFAHVLPGARIGRDCNICDHTFIENDVVVGDRVTIKCGVHLWDGIQVEDDVFIGPNATFTNDRFPRSKQHQAPGAIPSTILRKGSSIGAGVVILPGLTIGERAMVGAGSVVTRNVPPDTIVVGNPARIKGYVGTGTRPVVAAQPTDDTSVRVASRVRGVFLQRLQHHADLRGHLTFGEVTREIPFEVKRYFLVYGVSGRDIRGEHAHRELHQFLVCVHGQVNVAADDGVTREEFCLDDPSLGLYLPPLVWGVQYKHTNDAVLLVLASDHYQAADYIRDYGEFTSLVALSSLADSKG